MYLCGAQIYEYGTFVFINKFRYNYIMKKVNVHSLPTTVFYIFLIAIWVIILGVYINREIKDVRDLKRSTDISTIRSVVNMHIMDFQKLPDNISLDFWDYGYKLKKESKFVLYNLFEKGLFNNSVVDPLNNKKYYYRYHKFGAGEYGCDKEFAIFQIFSFERPVSDHGNGSCPNKNFVDDAPKGYTIQWFLKD